MPAARDILKPELTRLVWLPLQAAEPQTSTPVAPAPHNGSFLIARMMGDRAW